MDIVEFYIISKNSGIDWTEMNRHIKLECSYQEIDSYDNEVRYDNLAVNCSRETDFGKTDEMKQKFD